MMDVSFRTARQDESRILGAFFQEAAEGVADYVWSTMQEEGEDLLDVAERRFNRTDMAFSYENTIIAEDDGVAVGFALGFPMHVNPDEEPVDDPVLVPFSRLEQDDSYYLAGFCVSDSHRNRGIGTRLMAEVEKTAVSKGYARISLIVFAENQDGCRLYERLGFREIDRTPIIPHPMIHVAGDALLMSKALVEKKAA